MTNNELAMHARRLREARVAAGMSLEEAAGAISMPLATLKSYEAGTRQAKLTTFKKLAQLYNVLPSYLVGWDNEIKNESDYVLPASSSAFKRNTTPQNELVAFHRTFLEQHNINPMNCSLIQCTDDYCHTAIKTDDFAIVDNTIIKPDRPALFAIQDGDNLIFRWARRESGRNSFIIYSDDDKHFPPVRIEADETLKIVGKVIGVISWPGL